jgi:flagellin
MSSGLRITCAADDPAGLSISEKMKAQIRGLEQASRNAQDSISLMQTAEGAIGETTSVLQRIRELVVQASNGTYKDEDRECIQNEIDELLKQVDSVAYDTQFNDIKLLDGSLGKSAKGLSVQIGPNAGDQYGVNIENMDKTSLGIQDINVVGKTPAQISSMIDVVDKAIKSTSSQRSKIGASINAMERRIDYLDNAGINLQEAESRITDLDIAKATMEYAKTQVLAQVSMAMLAQANQNRNNIIQLLYSSLNVKMSS